LVVVLTEVDLSIETRPADLAGTVCAAMENPKNCINKVPFQALLIRSFVKESTYAKEALVRRPDQECASTPI
jgi:hypothetical protein